jgi:CRP-like cAMP-binding protein
MIDTDLQAALRRHHFVEAFEPAHVEKLAALARPVSFERDQVVFHEGDECNDFFIILSGMVALEVEEPDHTLRVQTLSAGDELGWSALLMASGKYFQARALEHSDTLAFDGPALLAECKRDPAFGFAFMYRLLHVVAARLQRTRLQVHDLYSPVAKRAGT